VLENDFAVALVMLIERDAEFRSAQLEKQFVMFVADTEP
jgi:hypothetical protein